jgi:hypothetical protein
MLILKRQALHFKRIAKRICFLINGSLKMSQNNRDTVVVYRHYPFMICGGSGNEVTGNDFTGSREPETGSEREIISRAFFPIPVFPALFFGNSSRF